VKKILAILLFSMLITFPKLGKAQLGTFTQIYAGNSYEEGVKAFRMPDKSYRIIGNTGSYGWGVTNIWIIALDSSAQFKWHKTISNGALDRANDAVMDSQGRIYLIGTSNAQSQNSYQLYLAVIDSAGSLLVDQYYGGQDWDFGNSIQLVGDSAILLAGETYSNASYGQSDAWLLKVDLLGNILWSKTIGGSLKESINALAVSDSLILTGGQSQSYGNGSYKPFVYCTNNQGDSLWLTQLQDTTEGAIYGLSIMDDTNCIAVGYQRDTSNLYQDLLVMKLNLQGQLIWKQTSLLYGGESYVKAVQNHKGKIAIGGMTTVFGNGGKEIFCSLLNRDGWWITSNMIGGVSNDFTQSLNLDTLGGELHYLLVGTTRSYGLALSGLLFARLDSNLLLDNQQSVFIPSEIMAKEFVSTDFELFPNPFSKNLNIKIPEKMIGESLKVSIFRTDGTFMLEKQIIANSSVQLIDLTELKAGTYLISLQSKTQIIRKLVVCSP
jgi:hypothetical protein